MLAALFERARREGRVALVPYVMAGDPDLETTEAILLALTSAGADLIELGIPYSDPLADGPAIAAAHQRALRAGTRLADVFALARRCRDRSCAPIVFFTYFNPVFRYGAQRFAREAAGAGGVGAIVPDLVLEETGELRDALHAHGLTMPLLVAPSTPPQRAARIAECASGFVYVVSRLGVTGAAQAPDLAPLEARLGLLRGLTEKPLAVGFGVSRPEEVQRIGSLADAVVVGSALVGAYEGLRGLRAARRVREFARALR